MDPFTRFAYRDSVPKEDTWTQWQDPSSLGGHALEALVACKVVHTFRCQSCLREGGLRHNGGVDDACSRADIVCILCFATYEVKSKKDMKSVQKGFRYGFQGGSFRLFAGFQEVGKRFLIAVNRKPERDNYGRKHHTIMLASIDHVTPTLTCRSFDGGVDEINIRTVIKTVDERVLCRLETARVDLSKIAEKVFDSKFGRGEWSGMDKAAS